MKKIQSSQSAFTLIELVVVMAIIGLLAAALAVGFSRQQGAGRDAKRRADLSTINTAVQSYLSDNNTVPNSASAGDTGTNGWDVSSVPTSGPAATDFMTFLKTGGYLTNVPIDPVNNGNATFYDKSGGTGTGYAYGYLSPISGSSAFPDDIIYTLVTILETSNPENNNNIYHISQVIRPL